MTPADTIREAARLMRERADAADRIHPQNWYETMRDVRSLPGVESQQPHLASWTPTVARALSSWLDHVLLNPSLDFRLGTDAHEALQLASVYLEGRISPVR